MYRISLTGLTTAALLLLPTALMAQGQCIAPSQCVAPNACAPPYCYVCPDDEDDLGDEEPGQYVTGPPTGEYIGESESIGMRGFRIRFPEISFELPSIQFPSFFHSRRNAEVRTDSQLASFSERQPIPLGPLLGDEDLGDEEGPGDDERDCYQPMYRCPPACVAPRGCTSTDVQRLEQQVAQLQGLVEQLAMLQIQQGGARAESVQQSAFQQPANLPDAPGTAVPSRAPAPESKPYFEIIEDTTHLHRSQPAVDTQAQREAERLRQAELERQAAQYNQKCREVDELRTQVAEMQQQYQLMLEMQQSQVFRQREERLRNRFAEQPVQQQTTQPRPMPASYTPPVRQPQASPISESATQSVFESPTSAQPRFRWQHRPDQSGSGVVRLSNLSP